MNAAVWYFLLQHPLACFFFLSLKLFFLTCWSTSSDVSEACSITRKRGADCNPDLTPSLFTHKADCRCRACDLRSLCSRCINGVIRATSNRKQLLLKHTLQQSTDCDSAHNTCLRKQQLCRTTGWRTLREPERAQMVCRCERARRRLGVVGESGLFPRQSPAHVSRHGALAAAALVHGLDHHPAGAAHPALRGDHRREG